MQSGQEGYARHNKSAPANLDLRGYIIHKMLRIESNNRIMNNANVFKEFLGQFVFNGNLITRDYCTHSNVNRRSFY